MAKVQTDSAEKSLVGRTKQRLKKLFGGEAKPTVKKETLKTNRTKQVEAGLKQAGLSDTDIAKFQPKGKK